MGRVGAALAVAAVLAAPASAQGLSRITALYPAGARAGTTVEVTIRGGGLEGASSLLVSGSGVSARLNARNLPVDAADERLFSSKCGLCHELRGPSSLARSAEQWAQTVDRMIRQRGAPIEAGERDRIVAYLGALARSGAGLTARVTVAPDAAPGRREIRVVSANGTSTVFPFEVTAQPELLETEPNDDHQRAPLVTLPVTLNGVVEARDVDRFAFQARKGERLVFNCNAYRLNPFSQAFFFPVLYLYDAAGRQLARNTGYFSLDPLIDWTAPEDGRYVIEVRDMLYRGSPASVYRLSAGALPYGTWLFPAGGRRGETVSATLGGQNLEPRPLPVTLPSDAPPGPRQVQTAAGSFPFLVGEHPEVLEGESGPTRATVPATLNGRFLELGETDRYLLVVPEGRTGAYSVRARLQAIGSPALPRITLRDGRGRQIGAGTAAPAGPDLRVDVNFPQAGEYVLEVGNEGRRGGMDQIYRLEVAPAVPELILTAGPDTVNLGAGAHVLMQLRVLRRVGVPGEIRVEFPELPPGVTVTSATIPPGANDGFAILSAAPDARPGVWAVTRPVARARTAAGEVVGQVLPLEYARINNNLTITPRDSVVVAVGATQPAWKIALEPSSPVMEPGRPLQVRVRIDRTGFPGDLSLAVLGLPPGVQGPRAVFIRRGTSEAVLTLFPTNQGVFSREQQGNRPESFELTVASGREGEGMLLAGLPVTIRLGGNRNP